MKTFRKIKFAVFISLALLLFTASFTRAANPGSTRSSEIKMKACQAKEGVIKTRMNNLLRLTNNIFRVFGDITARVEEFYQTKVTTEGKTVANYDTLKQTVQNKKEAAQASLTKANQDSQDFSCNNGNPKLALNTFRQDMQNVKSALKDYRTAIKNLIVAVHSVTGTMEKEKLTLTPKPTKIPD